MSSNVTLLNKAELWALYQDLIERSIKVATWYGHDLDAALGEHLENAGVYPRFPAAHNTGTRPE